MKSVIKNKILYIPILHALPFFYLMFRICFTFKIWLNCYSFDFLINYKNERKKQWSPSGPNIGIAEATWACIVFDHVFVIEISNNQIFLYETDHCATERNRASVIHHFRVLSHQKEYVF